MAGDSILIYVDSVKRAHFFKSFEPHFRTLSIEWHYITNKLSALPILRNNVTILKERKEIRRDIDYSFLNKSLSILNGYHSTEEGKLIASSVWQTLKERNFTTLWIWNGTTTIGRTLKAFGKKYNKKRVFFEISNIENRIFVDSWGIAGESFLYFHPEILDKFKVDEKKFNEWRERYRLSKKEVTNHLKSSIPWSNIIDQLGYKLGFIREDRRNILALTLKRAKNRVTPLPLEEPNFSIDYIFVPLQVSNDAQVKLFSKYTNEDLIKKALEIAKGDNLKVYIKPHPAEDDPKEIEKIKRFLQQPNVSFVTGDIFKLILNAKKIVVNNSTVGLEAKIFDKETIILGEAYYKNFNHHRIRAFIQHYLPQIKYFPPKVTLKDLEELIRL